VIEKHGSYCKPIIRLNTAEEDRYLMLVKNSSDRIFFLKVYNTHIFIIH